jgi:hypothetical protein
MSEVAVSRHGVSVSSSSTQRGDLLGEAWPAALPGEDLAAALPEEVWA